MIDLQAEIAKDRLLPANCFHVNGNGVLEEGIELQFNHPLCQYAPAIFVGERYIPRDAKYGCMYNDTNGRARRMNVSEVENFNGRKVNKLVRPHGQSLPTYLHIDPTVEFAPGVNLIERFFSGIVHNGTQLLWSFSGENLISFSDEVKATIFYSDGKVVQVVRMDGEITTLKPSHEGMATMRLEHAQECLETSSEPATTDRWYHEIISVMAIGGRRFPNVFDMAYVILEDAASSRKFGRSVQEHALTVLKKHWPAHALHLGQAFVPRSSLCDRIPGSVHTAPAPVSGVDHNLPLAVHKPGARKGPPAERKQKLAERRLAQATLNGDRPSSKGDKKRPRAQNK